MKWNVSKNIDAALQCTTCYASVHAQTNWRAKNDNNNINNDDYDDKAWLFRLLASQTAVSSEKLFHSLPCPITNNVFVVVFCLLLNNHPQCTLSTYFKYLMRSHWILRDFAYIISFHCIAHRLADFRTSALENIFDSNASYFPDGEHRNQ